MNAQQFLVTLPGKSSMDTFIKAMLLLLVVYFCYQILQPFLITHSLGGHYCHRPDAFGQRVDETLFALPGQGEYVGDSSWHLQPCSYRQSGSLAQCSARLKKSQRR